ncbi:MAG: hypothetical protein R2822_12755 [Spirosomataceae bacterium]
MPPAYFVRFGAYQVLGLLTDIEGKPCAKTSAPSRARPQAQRNVWAVWGDF